MGPLRHSFGRGPFMTEFIFQVVIYWIVLRKRIMCVLDESYVTLLLKYIFYLKFLVKKKLLKTRWVPLRYMLGALRCCTSALAPEPHLVTYTNLLKTLITSPHHLPHFSKRYAFIYPLPLLFSLTFFP